MAETATEPKARKAHKAQTGEQKKAAVLRSDAARLERLAMDSTNPEAMLATAAKLRERADTLAPAQVKATGAYKLTDQEWQAVETYFLAGDFRANLLQVTSERKLKALVAG